VLRKDVFDFFVVKKVKTKKNNNSENLIFEACVPSGDKFQMCENLFSEHKNGKADEISVQAESFW
jgi:hypothetical protein